METKKNILVFSDWYLPAYKAGGPVRSLAALAFHLKERFNFFIVTSNYDAFDKNPLPVKTNEWCVLPNSEKVYYIPHGKFSLNKLSELISSIPFDHVYLNSFFSRPFSILPMLLKKQGKIKKPVILAPRGMLGGGALSLKPAKKKTFIALARLGGLQNKITWHATSEQESGEIKKVFGPKAKVAIAPNLIMLPVHKREHYHKLKGELRLCFVSRISPKKNLLFALEILSRIQDGQVFFDIYGPAEDPVYLKKCIDLAKKMPSAVQVTFKGELKTTEVEDTLKQYHSFFLPTLNENFGHAIVEAMLNGCIPLLSDQTPWNNLKKEGIGWTLELSDKEGFVNALNELLSLSGPDFETQSINIQSFAVKQGINEQLTLAYTQLFK